MERKGDNINISFWLVTPNIIRVQSEQVEVTASDITPHISSDKPAFGPMPNTNVMDFDFVAETDCLPLRLNVGTDAKWHMLSRGSSYIPSIITQRSSLCMMRTLDTVTKSSIQYWQHQTSLFIYHTAPFPPQLQGEVHKCLDNWFWQGIIRPSQRPYASQVVIVWKKTGEICLCIDYQKLNSIMVRDAFPLPRIDETLQAVHSSNLFSSFNLAQGYLQLVMEESDIKKTAFRAGSMG